MQARHRQFDGFRIVLDHAEYPVSSPFRQGWIWTDFLGTGRLRTSPVSWVQRLNAPAIPGRGFNEFRPLRRHSRATVTPKLANLQVQTSTTFGTGSLPARNPSGMRSRSPRWLWERLFSIRYWACQRRTFSSIDPSPDAAVSVAFAFRKIEPRTLPFGKKLSFFQKRRLI